MKKFEKIFLITVALSLIFLLFILPQIILPNIFSDPNDIGDFMIRYDDIAWSLIIIGSIYLFYKTIKFVFSKNQSNVTKPGQQNIRESLKLGSKMTHKKIVIFASYLITLLLVNYVFIPEIFLRSQYEEKYNCVLQGVTICRSNNPEAREAETVLHISEGIMASNMLILPIFIYLASIIITISHMKGVIYKFTERITTHKTQNPAGRQTKSNIKNTT